MKRVLILILIVVGLLAGTISAMLVPHRHILAQTSPFINSFNQRAPTQLTIPKLGIDAPVEFLSVDKTGAMEEPKGTDSVGWFAPGTVPGEEGSAVIAGHLDSLTGPAIFYELNNLSIGDRIIVTNKKGEKLVFVVKDKQTYKDSEFPLQTVFSKRGGRYLNLITCAGSFDRTIKRYSDRVVIFTELES